jgi:hypothetical protein
MHSYWIPIGTNQSEHACDQRKPLNFQISKSDVITKQCDKKETFQETFSLSPAFLLYFENKKKPSLFMQQK